VSALKILRLMRKLSQWELGLAAEITNYKISQFECGKLTPTAEELQRLADALQTSPETLTREVSEESLLIA